MSHPSNRAQRLAARRNNKLGNEEKKTWARERPSKLRRKIYAQELQARETEDAIRAYRGGLAE